LLIGASCVVFWWVLYLNFTKTTLFYGVIGTAGQLSVFSVFAIAGIFSAILFVGIVFAIMSLFEPVYVVNRNGCRKA
jgi:quinol-cytochrome oxidoreductase complex cytochrome b subunit